MCPSVCALQGERLDLFSIYLPRSKVARVTVKGRKSMSQVQGQSYLGESLGHRLAGDVTRGRFHYGEKLGYCGHLLAIIRCNIRIIEINMISFVFYGYE